MHSAINQAMFSLQIVNPTSVLHSKLFLLWCMVFGTHCKAHDSFWHNYIWVHNLPSM